jgi:hypothetical protein
MSDAVNEIRLINTSDSDGRAIQGGMAIPIDVKEGQVIRHLFAQNGDFKKIRLDSGMDWTANKDTLIYLRYDSAAQMWLVLGTATGDILLSAEIFAEPLAANAYNLAAGGTITGFETDELLNCTVTNEGTASVAIVGDSYIDVGTGTIYGIKIFDNTSTLIYEIPCCENNIDCPYLHDTVSGAILNLSGVKTLITQDTYFKIQENGGQNITFIDIASTIEVAYKNDKTPIYIV